MSVSSSNSSSFTEWTAVSSGQTSQSGSVVDEDVSSVEKVKSRVFSVFSHLADSRESRRAVTVVLAVVEFLQIFALSFADSLAGVWSESDSWASVAYTFGAGHASHSVHVVLLWFAFAYLLLLAALSLRLSLQLHRGEEHWTRATEFLRVAFLLLEPVLYLPMLSYLLSLLSCNVDSSVLVRFAGAGVSCAAPASVIFSVVAAACVVATVCAGALSSAMFYYCFPSKSRLFAMTNSRPRMALFAFKTVLVGLNEFFYASPDLAGIGRIIYGSVLVLMNLVMVGFVVYYLPFYKVRVCYATAAAFSVSFLCAAVRFVMAAAVGGTSLLGLYAFAAGALPAAAVGFLVCLWRARSFVRAAKRLLRHDGSVKFEKEFEVEIAARLLSDADDAKLSDQRVVVYSIGVELFPQSAVIKLAHAAHILVTSEDFGMLQIVISRIRRMTLQIDQLYTLYRIDRRRRALVSAVDGGSEEIDLKLTRALKYQNECKRWIKAFWRHLSKEDDLNTLPEIVTAIDRNERVCDEIFLKLLVRFPRSVRILRAYGVFMEEVKNDIELSQLAFRSADEIEEDVSRRSQRKNQATMKGHRAHKDKREGGSKHDKKHDAEVVEDEGKERKRTLRFEGPPTDTDDDSDDEDPGAISEDVDHFDADDHMGRTGLQRMPSGEKPTLANLGDGAASTHVRANTKQRRIEMIRQRKYRRRIEHSKSTALQKLSAAIKITILVLLVDILVIYVSTKVILDLFTSSVTTLEEANVLRVSAHNLPYHSRRMQKAAVSGDLDSLEFNRAVLARDTTLFVTDLNLLYSMGGHEDIIDQWNQPRFQREDYYPAVGSEPERFTRRPTNLWDLSINYADAAFAVANMSTAELKDGATSKKFRFVMDHGPFELYKMYSDQVQNYQDDTLATATQLEITLFILLPLSVVILIFLSMFVFRPTLNQINQERSNALKLFTAIPKATVAQIFDKVAGTKDAEEIKDHEEEMYQEEMTVMDSDVSVDGSGTMPILKQLLVRYFSTLGVVLVIVAVMFTLGIYFVQAHQYSGAEINKAGARLYLMKRAQFLAEELTWTDNMTFHEGIPQIRSLLHDAVTDLELTQFGLMYGNDSMHLPGCINRDEAQTDLLYKEPCHLPSAGDKCRGLASLLNAYVEDMHTIIQLPDNHYFVNSTLWNEVTYLAGEDSHTSGELSRFMDRSTQLFGEESNRNDHSIDVALVVFFALSFPVLLGAYLLLRPLETRIREENARTMKMLLMIPIDVIDAVPAIREYLDTGMQESAQEKLKDALDLSVARNQTIVNASVDAIIVINELKLIELFNPSAQQMFGYTEEEALGKNVRMLMEDTIATAHDSYVDHYLETGVSSRLATRQKDSYLQGRRKDGSLFPVHLNVSSSRLNGKPLVAGFVRDMTEIKEYERRLVKEMEKSEQLLESMLPSVIAEQLKEHGLEGSKHLVAEGYKEVTVLFADIVGFTKISAGVAPSEIVFMLNQLFSCWDGLCGKYKIEKIKTIGDCYMAAGGCPERCVDHAQRVLNFAAEMFETLKEFNETYNKNLNLRIGINTGPVVAGVLGIKKITYDLWGDAVNVASRMESTGVAGRIQVSHSTFDILKSEYLFEERGKIDVKGKGLMLAYLYKFPKYERSASGHMVARPTLTPPPEYYADARRMSLVEAPSVRHDTTVRNDVPDSHGRASVAVAALPRSDSRRNSSDVTGLSPADAILSTETSMDADLADLMSELEHSTATRPSAALEQRPAASEGAAAPQLPSGALSPERRSDERTRREPALDTSLQQETASHAHVGRSTLAVRNGHSGTPAATRRGSKTDLPAKK